MGELKLPGTRGAIGPLDVESEHAPFPARDSKPGRYFDVEERGKPAECGSAGVREDEMEGETVYRGRLIDHRGERQSRLLGSRALNPES
jgi:hypothetical protein